MISALAGVAILASLILLPWFAVRSIDPILSFDGAVSANVSGGLCVTVFWFPIFAVTRPMARVTVNRDGLLLRPIWGLPPIIAVRWTDMSYVEVKLGKIRFSPPNRRWCRLWLAGLPPLSLGDE